VQDVTNDKENEYFFSPVHGLNLVQNHKVGIKPLIFLIIVSLRSKEQYNSLTVKVKKVGAPL